jgi:tRNA A37 threonylcarbamoyltransferase TsaD
LRSALTDALGNDGRLFHPSPRMATDNGAMIARAAAYRHARGEEAGLDLTARADLPFPGLVHPATVLS